jgi:uncharacterized protein (DUF885 family)
MIMLQAIIVHGWQGQIMRLLGKYRDKQGANFRLGQFHDDLIKNGNLPLSIVEWRLLDDSSSLDQALK